jgi:two-component system, OmpR family, sensor histidine kinase KdpD
MRVSSTNEVTRLTTGALVGSALVLSASYCAFWLHFNLPTAGFIHLLIVVLAALRFGFWEATGCSFVAVACLAYFFAPPIYSFHVDDPENWVALVTFEIIALIVSRLSNQLRSETQESLLHQRNAERLYEFSRSVLVLDRQRPAGAQIAPLIEKHIGVDCVAIFDGLAAESFMAGSSTKEEEELARTTYLWNENRDSRDSARWQRVLRSESNPVGAIVMSGHDLNSLMVDAVASLVASAFERVRSFEKESRAQAARQAEQLRTTVLDGLAHAFKTPLTVILTSTSGLFEMNNLSAPEAQLVGLIEEHATQLNALTSHLLQMAKLDSKEIRLCCEEVLLPLLIRQIVDHSASQLYGHKVELSVPEGDLSVSGDRRLLASTITELLVNAAKYSTTNSVIRVSLWSEEGKVLVSVHNDGPIIDGLERTLIFDRFYRSPATRHSATGSGIGLSVAKRAVEAHQGSMWVNSSAATGTTFILSLPALAKSEYADCAE